MTLRVIGSGLGRTGTHSLKGALETLLGSPCYHMAEVFERPDDVPVWKAAAEGTMPDWVEFFKDYRAAVDWPASAFWAEIAEAFPDAVILHSEREFESWWKSASNTIFVGIDEMKGSLWHGMIEALFTNTFTADLGDKESVRRVFEAHNRNVLETADPARLLRWRPGDGWEPICKALDLPVPSEPFPHTNTTEEFNARRDVARAEALAAAESVRPAP
ncbi:MAG: sulfotransferase family protein [Dehalococcoidia bacterium]